MFNKGTILDIVYSIKFEGPWRGVCRVRNVTAAEHVEWQMTPAHEQAVPAHLPRAKLYLHFLCLYHLSRICSKWNSFCNNTIPYYFVWSMFLCLSPLCCEKQLEVELSVTWGKTCFPKISFKYLMREVIQILCLVSPTFLSISLPLIIQDVIDVWKPQ